MAVLILHTEQIPCPWPTIEARLAGWGPDLEFVSQREDSRTYQLNLADQGQPITALLELQTLLAHEEVHFFIDLKS